MLRGIWRTIGTARAGKAPATADVLMQMVALCPDNMIGRRDRALLALGFRRTRRRSERCTLLAAAEISAGPVFRERRAGREALAHRVGLEASTFSGHSLRSGFLTSAAESGANVFKMARCRGIAASTRCAATSGGWICSRSTPARPSCEAEMTS